MFERLINRQLLISAICIAALCGSCAKSDPQATPSATVTNSPASGGTPGAQNSGIEFEAVVPQTIAGGISATGKVLVMDDRTASIGPVNEGRITNLYAGQGSVVRKGQKLADFESADIDQAEADYLKAQADSEAARRTSAAEIKFAQQTYDRTKMLFEKSVTAGKNLQQAEHDLELAKTNGANAIESAKVAQLSARRHLLILGLKDSAIDSLGSKPGLTAGFSLVSPISGIVVERNATIGATVGSDANLFKIIDLSTVWIDVNVFEKDLGRVKLGQAVKITVPAYPESTFYGKVIMVLSVVDPDTRTVRVRTEVSNGDGRLKPDMFANAEIVTDFHGTTISLPLSAVLDDGGKPVVFVADGDAWKKRPVTTGLKSDDRVEITSGLNAGDKVAVKGNYLLMEQSKADQ